MFGWVKRAKELWSWYSFAVGVGTLFVTGFGIAVTGAAWAIKAGAPIPFAIMAGYCTLVGAVYLALAPMVYRALTRAQQETPRTNEPLPNYDAWRHIEHLSILEAAYLWCDIEPEPPGFQVPNSVAAWTRVLVDNVKREKIDIHAGRLNTSERQRLLHQVDWNTKIEKSELRKFAKEKGYDPKFLREGSSCELSIGCPSGPDRGS